MLTKFFQIRRKEKSTMIKRLPKRIKLVSVGRSKYLSFGYLCTLHSFRAGMIINLYYYQDWFEEKLSGRKKCPVDHTNRSKLKNEGTDHSILDQPVQSGGDKSKGNH